MTDMEKKIFGENYSIVGNSDFVRITIKDTAMLTPGDIELYERSNGLKLEVIQYSKFDKVMTITFGKLEAGA